MIIADNIKCKDFTLKLKRGNSQLRGQENLYCYDILYKGTHIITFYGNKKQAQKWVSNRVKKVNLILEKARKEMTV